MTLRLSAIITADAQQAKTALAETATGAKQAGDALQGMGNAGAGAAPKVVPPLQQLPPLMNQTARSTDGAAGAVGNLVAQFNDIGMMMAAGQNPLMLAIQQGSQITQVIGPMGAAGAMKALGGALVSLVSPINLVTLGVIAAGTVAVQWFMDAGEEAVSLSDRISEMADAVDAFKTASADAALPWQELVSKFGSADPMLRATLNDLAGMEKVRAFESIKATAAALNELSLATAWWDDASANTSAQRFLGFQRNSELARQQAAAFVRSMGELSSPDATSQLRGATDLKALINDATGGYANMNAEQRQFYEGLTDIVLKLQAMGVTIEQAATAQEGLNAAQIAGYEAMARSRIEAEAAEAAALKELQTNEQKAKIAALTAQYGAESVQVAQAKFDIARAEYEAHVKSLEVSDDLKAQMMASWDAANGIAKANMAGAIGGAAAEAARLAQNLGISLDVAERLAAAQRRAAKKPEVVFDPRDPRYDPIAAEQARILADPNRGKTQAEIAARAAKSDRSGGGATDKEAKAIANLIGKYERELDLLREADPVKREMIRLRDQLARATEPEREAVERLITTLQREKDIADSRREGEAAINSYFMKVAQGANAAQTAVDMFLESVLKAVIQGEGPLASLFGTRGTSLGSLIFGGGGLFGGLFGGGTGTGTLGLPKFADGGMIYGFGGGRDDRMPVWKSPGEFTVNARATARNRALLEFINGGGELGGLPGFADGGMLRGSAQPRVGGPAVSMVNHFDLRGAADPAETERAAMRGMQAALDAYSRNALPGEVRRIQANPLRVG